MLCKYNHVSKRKTSSKNMSMFWGQQTQCTLQRSWMDPYGKYVAGLQMVGMVKEGYLQVHETTRKGLGHNPKTHRIYLSEWWQKLFKSAISREIWTVGTQLCNAQLMCPIPPLIWTIIFFIIHSFHTYEFIKKIIIDNNSKMLFKKVSFDAQLLGWLSFDFESEEIIIIKCVSFLVRPILLGTTKTLQLWFSRTSIYSVCSYGYINNLNLDPLFILLTLKTEPRQ